MFIKISSGQELAALLSLNNVVVGYVRLTYKYTKPYSSTTYPVHLTSCDVKRTPTWSSLSFPV